MLGNHFVSDCEANGVAACGSDALKGTKSDSEDWVSRVQGRLGNGGEERCVVLTVALNSSRLHTRPRK